jgi:hypothetical protein
MKKGHRASFSAHKMASGLPGQLWFVLLPLGLKLNFLPYVFSDNGHSVLDAQALKFAVVQFSAILYERPPSRMYRCVQPIFSFSLGLPVCPLYRSIHLASGE